MGLKYMAEIPYVLIQLDHTLLLVVPTPLYYHHFVYNKQHMQPTVAVNMCFCYKVSDYIQFLIILSLYLP